MRFPQKDGSLTFIRRHGFAIAAWLVSGWQIVGGDAAQAATALHFGNSQTTPDYGVVLVQLYPKPAKLADARPCRAKLGDTLEVGVDQIEDWLKNLKEKKVINSDKEGDDLIGEQIQSLCLFLNGKPLRTIHAVRWLRDDPRWYEYVDSGEQKAAAKRCFLKFELVRNASDPKNRADWDQILKIPHLAPQLELTVGIYQSESDNAYVLPTSIRPISTDPAEQFFFCRIACDPWLVAGALVLGSSFFLFLYLTFRTTIIRDPGLPLREDGLPPVSLGRFQMAFWFFLVAGAFFFLWIVTGRGDLDTVNGTVLALIGISAGTALGAAVIANNAPVTATTSHQPVRNYPQEIAEKKNSLAAAESDRRNIDPNTATAPGLLAANDLRQAQLRAELNTLQAALRQYRRAHRTQFITDLLSEDVEGQPRPVVSFHRFQIFVWTLMLGVVFVSGVATNLAMPVFDNSLLLLMGISSGTYLGFKFPAAKPAS